MGKWPGLYWRLETVDGHWQTADCRHSIGASRAVGSRWLSVLDYSRPEQFMFWQCWLAVGVGRHPPGQDVNDPV